MSPLPSPRWLERSLFASSLALVVGVAAALLVFDRPFEPDDIAIVPRIRTEAVDRTADRLIVPFEVSNRGQASVDDVTVEITLPGRSGQVREQHITHLPEGATHRGVVVFYGPSGDARPRARVVGYQLP